MRRTEVDVFYNEKKGYIFASKTNYLGRVVNGTVKPVLHLSIDEANDEMVGEYVRQALDISRNADPIDKDMVGVYEYWKESGMRTFSAFSKKYTFIEIEEIKDALFYRMYIHDPRGGYIASCRAEERESVSLSISNKELGELVKLKTK